MALITASSIEGKQWSRSATAQADTGQTDSVIVPQWAKYCVADLNLISVAGTGPSDQLRLRGVDPVSKNDNDFYRVNDLGGAWTLTGAGHLVVCMGVNVTGLADDLTMAATGFSHVSMNMALPAHIGVQQTLSRANADETYTYNVSLYFRSGLFTRGRNKGKGRR